LSPATLTINRLEVTGSLVRSLESTNPVESMIEIVRDPRPQGEALPLRGDGAAVGRCRQAGRAKRQFRRVKGPNTDGARARPCRLRRHPGPVRGTDCCEHPTNAMLKKGDRHDLDHGHQRSW
jgi:hypothetical protein